MGKNHLSYRCWRSLAFGSLLFNFLSAPPNGLVSQFELKRPLDRRKNHTVILGWSSRFSPDIRTGGGERWQKDYCIAILGLQISSI
jgi:hypothetical protein